MVSTKNGGHHCGYSKLRSAVGAGRTLTLFRRVQPDLMEKSSEKLSSDRLRNFYGKNNPLTYKYVREKPDLNVNREAEQRYSLEHYLETPDA